MRASVGGLAVGARCASAFIRNARRALLALSLLCATSSLAHAQRSTATAGRNARALADTIPDSLQHPPIAPRRAMLYSMLLPGFSQSRLNRPTSSIIFAVAEVLSLGMARKAALDLREARAARSDSIPTGFTADTVTGVITATGYTQNRLVARIGARRTHYEDWLAALIFNHIISGADAYVAANLWDFNANVAVTPTRNGAAVAASLSF
ncbi:MAG: hypothetical protein M3R65_08055 [Gemmatimonadota bacterium]|nr:hypothetical protein [Gemmatimonadota bacterium]